MEFTYCVPGVLLCDSPTSQRTKGASYTFSGCEFSHNRAGNLNAVTQTQSTYYVFELPYKMNHQAFGQGGGLSLFIRGNASDITFTVKDSEFYKNEAEWGGGFFMQLHDNAFGNKINVMNSSFHENRCTFTIYNGTGGGGIRLGHYIYGLDAPLPIQETRNEFIIDNCTFAKNIALDGAGISVSWALQNSNQAQVALIHILNSYFVANIAKLGIAIHVNQFWMLTKGLMPIVWIESCHFDSNLDIYYMVPGSLSDDYDAIPYPTSLGVVYVTSTNVWFRGNISFTNNRCNALAVSGSCVNFNGCSVQFINNVASEGSGILLLGASVIDVGYGTEMLFQNNHATRYGAAIHAVYISRENLVSDAKCFIRHVDPLIHPDDWNVTMKFINNTDIAGVHRNSIFATSILPCSAIGGSGFLANETRVLCWKGWHYYNENIESESDCDSQISTGIGKIAYIGNETGGKNYVKAYPGWDFEMPLSILDDLNEDISMYSVFTARNNVSRSLLFVLGKKANLNGTENSSIQLTLETIGERVWHVNMLVNLQLCPPGFVAKNGSCQCSNNYGSTLYCNGKIHEASIPKNIWFGAKNGTYYTVICPPNYCRKYFERDVLLPQNAEDLDEVICSEHRTGVMCGECEAGYGPAVNSRTYDCVNCTDIKLAANIAKYVASVYLPLVFLFMVLIVFDIRLTTGPANAFIIYAQVISSMFSIDADGGIPLDQFSVNINSYIIAYRFPYGIFNLDFVENYIPSICFSMNFNTLTVLLLQYCVAISPLLMIMIILICLKIKECCCPRLSESSKSRSSLLIERGSRNIQEALLPGFASFLLLSYNKFSNVSSYLVISQPLVDENGKDDTPARLYLAGQFSTEQMEYVRPYFIPAMFVFCTIVFTTPLLLLDYPLRAFEWVVFKFEFLRKRYPITKIRILLDTFQGCYKINMRFFAGVYFLFRLVINVSYIFCNTWLDQFIVQQIACSLMVAIIALCQPYERNFLNYVDILIFTDLAIVNGLSFYLFSIFKSHRKVNPPMAAFVLQYCLVFIPLIYMLLYMLHYLYKKHQRGIKYGLYLFGLFMLRCCTSPQYRLQQLNSVIRDDVSSTSHISSTSNLLKYNRVKPIDDIEAMLERAQDQNTYQPTIPVTVVGMKKDGYEGDASVHQTHTLLVDNSCQKLQQDSGSGGNYGSTGTSTVQSDSGNY